jgi:hypothetical protein
VLDLDEPEGNEPAQRHARRAAAQPEHFKSAAGELRGRSAADGDPFLDDAERAPAASG